eukprot:TRINITY_DN2756_c0_g1_i1.p1 TRINITY_DN2756_c0_g1~~TRINITY_DN2756_c0_g1_i1.p1  ORF type:complete len:889 (+),score=295.48 TRINITY_DN2756_c0_g1_i1:100-2766(+)
MSGDGAGWEGADSSVMLEDQPMTRARGRVVRDVSASPGVDDDDREELFKTWRVEITPNREDPDACATPEAAAAAAAPQKARVAPPGPCVEEDFSNATALTDPQTSQSQLRVSGRTESTGPEGDDWGRRGSRCSSEPDIKMQSIRSVDVDDVVFRDPETPSELKAMFKNKPRRSPSAVTSQGFTRLALQRTGDESGNARRPPGAPMHQQHADPLRLSGSALDRESDKELTGGAATASNASFGMEDGGSGRRGFVRGFFSGFGGGEKKRESMNFGASSGCGTAPPTPLTSIPSTTRTPRAADAPPPGLPTCSSTSAPNISSPSDADLVKDSRDTSFSNFNALLGEEKRGSVPPPPAKSQPSQSGWLEKKGAAGLIKMFRRRWFELHHEFLYYFQGEGDRVLGRISLADPDVRAAVLDIDGRDHGFELSGRSLPRTYELIAESEEDRNEWVQKITKAVNWCSVASAEEMHDWLDGLLPSTTRMTIEDFNLIRLVGTGSFANVVKVTLKESSAMRFDEDRTKWLTNNLTAFYNKHRPDRIRGVEVLVRRCAPGGERELHGKLLERFPHGGSDLGWLLDPPSFCARKEKGGGDPMDGIFAMKIIKKSALPSIKVAKMMMEEKAILQSMKHPYIVRLHYAFQTDTKLYLILTYLSGQDLRHHLNETRKLDEARSRFYAAQILLALDHLHSHGIVYRDLKPQNVVLDHNGHAVLTDLGLATDITDTGRAYTFCGTPQYVAPEVLQGQAYSKAVDFWALGVVMYEMLVGATPFQGGDSLQDMFLRIMEESIRFPSVVTKPAREFVTACLERDMNKRLCALSVCKHWKLFKGINWQDLRNRKIPAPYVPPAEADDAGAAPLDISDLIPEMVKPVIEDQFEGFTYMEHSPMVQKPMSN